MATRKSNDTIPCRMRLVRDGVEFEVEGDQAFVLEMVKQFAPSSVATAHVIGSVETGAPSVIAATSKGLSIREFIGKLESRKHTDLILAFGYYLEKYMGQPNFTPADINNLYYEAKLDTSNTSQMIIQNIKRGHLMEDKKAESGGKKQYILTHSGEEVIEKQINQSKP